jgi:hypothetical protein
MSIQHRRHIIARPEECGAPLVRAGNVPGRTWPLTITARTVAGPSGTENREVHLIIDNETDLDILEYGIRAQRERLALYGDTGRLLPDGSRT